MIVSKKHFALLLRLRNPAAVTSVIPKAKLIQFNGITYVAVRHRLDEVKVLRNIGISAPSPINYYYEWPGRFSPFKAQQEAASFLTLNTRAFNLSDMGTGKTMASLWAYDYLKKLGKVNKLLVISPLSTLERTWADELFNHFPHLTSVVLHGTRERRLKLLEVDADVYLINHDGVKVKGLLDALDKRPDISLVIVDEISQMARNSGTERFAILNKIINGKVPRNAWGLTGTPTPNEPTDAWAQCRLLVPSRVSPYFTRFKQTVMKQTGPFSWQPRPDAMDIVHNAMQPAIRFTRDECVDLPPCTFQMRNVELSKDQKTHYREMFKQLKTEIASGQVTAVNEAVKAQKLIQIACGVVYGQGDGNEATMLDIDAAPRLAVLKEIIEEANTKVIIFVPFVSAVAKVDAFLKSENFTTAVIHGGISKNDRDVIFRAFQTKDDPKVLIAQPATLSHGLTLTAASTIVWYAPITSADTFTQANARIVRPGQNHSQLIVMVEGSEIERKYYKRLKDKQKTQGILLDLVKEGREDA